MRDSRIHLREKTADLYSPSGEKPKHSKARVSNLFMANPMCQLGNISLQQREIFRSSTQTWLPSSACSVSIQGPRMIRFLPKSQPHMHVPHMGFFPPIDLSVCLKTELPGTVLDKADDLSL